MDQLVIALTGAVAVWLSQDKRAARRKWACIFGLAGQPFWFYATWTAEQYGIFVSCLLYTYSWASGVKNNWFSAKVID